MCITNPLKISDFQGNLLHMLLFLQKHAFYFSILRIKEGLLHVQQPLGATGRIRTSGLPGRRTTTRQRKQTRKRKFVGSAYLPPKQEKARCWLSQQAFPAFYSATAQ